MKLKELLSCVDPCYEIGTTICCYYCESKDVCEYICGKIAGATEEDIKNCSDIRE